MTSSDRKRPTFRKWTPLLILAGAGAVGWWIYRTGPVTKPEEEKRAPRIVKTVEVTPSDAPIVLSAFGSVIPARRVSVEPQVSGHVVRQHPSLVTGGLLNQGEELYAIDPSLSELDAGEAAAEVDRARAELAEAQRRWDEAQRLAEERIVPATELASLESTVRIREAELKRLEVRLAREQELLERHSVRAPFNSMVLQEAVDIGQRVDPGDSTATLVGTDQFWVRASLPTDLLAWVRLPERTTEGASAEVFLDTGGATPACYPGRVVQLLGNLEEAGRMARVLVAVDDPLRRNPGAEGPPLLLDSYVRVEIDAGCLTNVLAVDRQALREGDRLWVVDRNSTLQIRDARVRWRQGETVFVDPVLTPGEALIVSELPLALPGMEVTAQPAEEVPETTAGLTAKAP